jgi:hypothetical protein
MLNFFSGMVTTGFLIAALFFFRFWRRTGDTLFVIFGVSFLLFAVNQGATSLADIPREEQSWIYLFRLAGFVLLLIGILAKNLGPAATR